MVQHFLVKHLQAEQTQMQQQLSMISHQQQQAPQSSQPCQGKLRPSNCDGAPNPIGGVFQPSSCGVPLMQKKENSMVTIQHDMNSQPNQHVSPTQPSFQQFQQQQLGRQLQQMHLSGLVNMRLANPVNIVDASYVSISLPDFTGGWQSNADLPDRRKMIVKMIKLIEKIRPGANKMAIRVPLLVKKLEKYLYRSAPTKAKYIDTSTLKRRLQGIALSLSQANRILCQGGI
jgi:hypothetical protein